MRILLVEDDPAIADGITDALADVGHEITHVITGTAAIDHLAASAADLVVLDLGLPDQDGTDVCRRIRVESDIPIIVVSARSDEIDRVLALEMGADDYLVKPFGVRELIARIRSVMRRSQSGSAPQAAADLGELRIDVRAQRVRLAGESIHLTPTEFSLLVYLAEEPGAVRRRADIIREVWKTEWFGTAKTLDAHIAALRRKLGDPRWIESVRGVGFRFEVPR